MKALKVIRRFEKFNFQGVPERPEPMFQRNNYSQFTERQTGQTINPNLENDGYEKSPIIGYIKDDFKKKEESFIAVKNSK